MTASAVPRMEPMAGFNAVEPDEVHTPSSHYSLDHASLFPSNPSGLYAVPRQTGPGDHSRSPWEISAEGHHIFPDVSHGEFVYNLDCEEPINFGQATPRVDQDVSVSKDLPAKWTIDVKNPKSEPMRRITSKSSAGSSKHRTLKATSKKSRPRVHSAALMSRASSQFSNYETTGSASVFVAQDATIGIGRTMDPQQYLQVAQDLDSLSMSPHMAGAHVFHPGMMAMGVDGLPFPADNMGFPMAQHVNPCATQFVAPGFCGSSTYSHSLDSLSPDSRNSSPGADEVWSAGAVVASPSTDAHDSPSMIGPSPSLNNLHSDGTQIAAAVIPNVYDDISLPPPFTTRRMSGETAESARDHWLYKTAQPAEDGLFHCPFENYDNCNHKPEKLKCVYDKNVDSHLKPYRCRVELCSNTRFSSVACLLRHEREAHAMHGHGDKPYRCPYEGCERALTGNGFPRQWNLRDHMKRVHNDTSTPGAPVTSSSPPVAATATGVTTSSKGRKRKSKDVTAEATTVRKASTKAAAQVAAPVAAVKAAAEAPKSLSDFGQWFEHQKALQSLVQGWTEPQNPVFLQQYETAYGHMNSMQQISYGYQTQPGGWHSG